MSEKMRRIIENALITEGKLITPGETKYDNELITEKNE